jgi:hypothetical protein
MNTDTVSAAGAPRPASFRGDNPVLSREVLILAGVYLY